MSEQAPLPGPPQRPEGPAPPRAFRWQALFQQAEGPVFVLDRRRRIRFVNRAWEALARLTAEEARGLICRRRLSDRPVGASLEDVVAYALAPPPEVLQGQVGQARRLLPASAGFPPACWDVEFFPLSRSPVKGGGEGAFILGRIAPVVLPAAPTWPPLPEKLVALRARAVARLGPGALASEVPRMRRLAEQVRLAARVRVPILLVGEPGTGKQALARLIHAQSADRERPFAALDCERLPPNALARALFEQRPALGAVYLREPARLPRDLQSRLAEVLTASAESTEGPRILAGASAPLLPEGKVGRVVEDLACALGTLVLDVPPLRERRDDLPRLAEALLAREDAKPLAGLTPAAWEALRAHAWPGNLRELSEVLNAAREHAKGERIDAADLPSSAMSGLRSARQVEQAPARAAERPLELAQVLEQVERRLIERALRRAGGNKTRAAELLSIWRPRLQRRMEALGMEGPSREEG